MLPRDEVEGVAPAVGERGVELLGAKAALVRAPDRLECGREERRAGFVRGGEAVIQVEDGCADSAT
jgi:hypothetical protein